MWSEPSARSRSAQPLGAAARLDHPDQEAPAGAGIDHPGDALVKKQRHVELKIGLRGEIEQRLTRLGHPDHVDHVALAREHVAIHRPPVGGHDLHRNAGPRRPQGPEFRHRALQLPGGIAEEQRWKIVGGEHGQRLPGGTGTRQLLRDPCRQARDAGHRRAQQAPEHIPKGEHGYHHAHLSAQCQIILISNLTSLRLFNPGWDARRPAGRDC